MSVLALFQQHKYDSFFLKKICHRHRNIIDKLIKYQTILKFLNNNLYYKIFSSKSKKKEKKKIFLIKDEKNLFINEK